MNPATTRTRVARSVRSRWDCSPPADTRGAARVAAPRLAEARGTCTRPSGREEAGSSPAAEEVDAAPRQPSIGEEAQRSCSCFASSRLRVRIPSFPHGQPDRAGAAAPPPPCRPTQVDPWWPPDARVAPGGCRPLDVAQVVARPVRDGEVVGSSPAIRTQPPRAAPARGPPCRSGRGPSGPAMGAQAGRPQLDPHSRRPAVVRAVCASLAHDGRAAALYPARAGSRPAGGSPSRHRLAMPSSSSGPGLRPFMAAAPVRIRLRVHGPREPRSRTGRA